MNSIFEDLWVRETMVLFRKWRILFMEGARMQSVHEFEGEMWVNGWEWEEEESWIWKPINHESLQEPGHTGFYKPYKEMDFFPRKWRSFKGLRQVTDMTKFLFWNAHSDCRSASWKEAGQLASTWSEKGQWSEPILDVLSLNMSI